MKKTIALEVMSALLILLFIYASFSKYADFPTFKQAMFRQPFAHWLSSVLIYLLPPLEIGLALALMFEGSRVWALRASLLLMSAFTLYILLILLHAFAYVPCSCGGVISALSWNQHFFFNLFFIFISALSLRLELKLRKDDANKLTHQKPQA